MRLILVDKKELEMGIEKEMKEHGMTPEKARKTAIDHLKERPDYYSVAEKAGLEEEDMVEWNDSIFKKGMTGGRMKRLKKVKGPYVPVGATGTLGGIPLEEAEEA